MSGRGIADLAYPSRSMRVDQGAAARRSGFETLSDSQKEDLLRVRRLRRTAMEGSGAVNVEAAKALANRLAVQDPGGDAPKSVASSVYMREQRIKITGALSQLIKEVGGGMRVTKFAIIPASWEFTVEQLPAVNLVWLLVALRTALYQMGAATATGWVFLGLHGEFDPVAKVFRLHVHGIAYGGMVKVVDRLRTLPNYKTSRWLPDGSPSPVYRRVRMTHKPLDRLPRPLTYLVQSFWPARALWVSEDGRRRRAHRKRRIPEPFHSQVLLWLDKWSIDDLTLMIGLRVTKIGLKQTKLVS